MKYMITYDLMESVRNTNQWLGATARAFAGTPERMALIAGMLGMVSAAGGLALSYVADTPAGPTIVSVAATLFLVGAIGGTQTPVRRG